MRLNKAYKYLLFSTLCIAALFRLLYVAQLRGVFWVDEIDYMKLGESIAHGRGFVTPNGEPTAFRAPGYPVLLAALHKIGFKTAADIRIVHIFLNVTTIYLLSLLSLKIAGPVASIIATIVAAGYPYFIYGVGVLFPMTWFSLLYLLSVYMLLSGLWSTKMWYIAFAGILMGASILTRVSAVVLALSVVSWLFVLLRRQPKRLTAHILLYLCPLIIVVLPWLIRNHIKMGTMTVVTNGGRNLWLGNNPASTIHSGSDIKMPPSLAERIAAATESEAELIYVHEVLQNLRSAPFHYLGLAAQKSLALWRFDPSPTTIDEPSDRKLFDFLSYISYMPILFLAILGYIGASAEQRQIMLLWIFFGITFTLLHAVFFPKVRFRLPLDYILILMASSGLTAIFGRLTLARRFAHHQPAGFLYDQSSFHCPRLLSRRH